MTMTIIGDQEFLWGAVIPDLPVQVSPDVQRYKIRARHKEFARIFLRLTDRTEEWYLGSDGEHLFPHTQIGENRRP